jgi:hypothetical protein
LTVQGDKELLLEDMAPLVDALRMMPEMAYGMTVERMVKARNAPGRMRAQIARHRSLFCAASHGA